MLARASAMLLLLAGAASAAWGGAAGSAQLQLETLALASALELGNECLEDEGTCALSALQLRGLQRAAGAAAAEAATAAAAAGRGADSLCRGAPYDPASEGCCGDKATFLLDSQACCGDTAVYTLKSEGCCADSTVFELSATGACTAAGATAADAMPPAAFTCRFAWPLHKATKAWTAYCANTVDGAHKAWAMTTDCKAAAYAANGTSADDAEMEALDSCMSKAKRECTLFDTDGKICKASPQARTCGTDTYDAGSQGCCAGTVYDLITEDCCGDTQAFKRGTEECCAGTVFTAGPQGCCGGKVVYDTETSGCCVNRGIQIYKLGKQNCCAIPGGVCTIQHGQWSCCKGR